MSCVSLTLSCIYPVGDVAVSINAHVMGAIFIKLGRAPATIVIFISFFYLYSVDFSVYFQRNLRFLGTHFVDKKLGILRHLFRFDFIGTFAFAISGTGLASAKRFDWFGVYVVGLATGGGRIRDVLLNMAPGGVTISVYLICTGMALLWVIFFG